MLFLHELLRAIFLQRLFKKLRQKECYSFFFKKNRYVIPDITRKSTIFNTSEAFCLRTVNDLEIDLIIERPNQTTLLIEIKSVREVYPEMFKPLQRLHDIFPDALMLVVSNDPYAKIFGEIKALPWQQAIEYIFSK